MSNSFLNTDDLRKNKSAVGRNKDLADLEGLKKKQMKSFDIPLFYRSPVISKIKNFRKNNDPGKKDYSPTELDLVR